MIFKRICLSVCILFFVSSISAEEMKNNDQNNQYNIYTGMFDFSGDTYGGSWFDTTNLGDMATTFDFYNPFN